MSEKKELNQEELEKVSGGEYFGIGEINWLFSKNEKAYVILANSTQTEGKALREVL